MSLGERDAPHARALGVPRRRPWRAALAALALALAALEAVDAFFIDVPAAAAVAAVLFLAGSVWLRREGRAPVVFVGVLCVIELAGLPSYDRDSASDWIFQVAAGILAALGVAFAAAAWRAGDVERQG
jgi:hypothetical protein